MSDPLAIGRARRRQQQREREADDDTELVELVDASADGEKIDDGGNAPKRQGPEQQPEAGTEEWIQTQSLAADESANTSINAVYVIMSIMSSNVAQQILTSYLLPLTDHLFLLLVGAAEATLLLKFVQTAFVTWFHDRRRMGAWLHSVLLLLNFAFYVCFWTTFLLIQTMFGTLFTVSADMATAAGFVLFFIGLYILFFAAHPHIGLVTHISNLLEASPAHGRAVPDEKVVH